MLKFINITDFQCFKSMQIELDPHVTVLVGDNGAGKSAAVRALLWASMNKWGGKADTFIYWGADDARVELVFDNGSVARQKGAGGNLYFLNGERLEGDVSRSIPVSYRKLVNLNEDNFHEQLDPAFWFSLTAGQVAKSLNKIVNLCSIDDSLTRVSAELRSAREEAKVVTSRLQQAQEIKESLSWVPDADSGLADLERQSEELTQFKHRFVALARKIEEANVLLKIRNDARSVILSGKRAIGKIEKLHKLRSQLTDLTERLNRLDAAETGLADLRGRLKEKHSRLHQARAGKCPLCGRS